MSGALNRPVLLQPLISFCLLFLACAPARAQGIPTPVNIRFQGQLYGPGGGVLNGVVDFRFTLWDALSGGSQRGPVIPYNNTPVTNGWVNLSLNFGSIVQFTGDARWLQIEVRQPAGSGSFTTLSPRQAMLPVPYAIHALGPWKLTSNDVVFEKGKAVVRPSSGNATYSMEVPLTAPGGAGVGAGPFFNPTTGKTYYRITPRSWTNAQIAAQNLGGNLVTINDAAENEWLRTNVMSGITRTWIGLSDAATEGTFVWADGTNAGYRNWGAGQPDDGGGSGEDFVVLNTDGTWSDESTATPLTGIAEITGPTGTAAVDTEAGSGILRFLTDGTPRLVVDRAGNVGYGVATPLQRLHISGNILSENGNSFASRATNGAIETWIWPRWNDNVMYVNYGQAGWQIRNSASTNVMMMLPNGNVGIGTSEPEETLDVNGNVRIAADSSFYFGAESENTDPIYFRRSQTAANESVLELVVGDDPTGPSDLDVFKITTRPAGPGSPTERFQFWSDGSAYKPGGGAWSDLSDARTKCDVAGIEGALDRLLTLRGVWFSYSDPAAAKAAPGRRTGFVAQEVERVFPEWVSTRPDGMKMVTVTGFEATAVEALRELRAEKDMQVEALRAELAVARDENRELRERLEAIEAYLRTVGADR